MIVVTTVLSIINSHALNESGVVLEVLFCETTGLRFSAFSVTPGKVERRVGLTTETDSGKVCLGVSLTRWRTKLTLFVPRCLSFRIDEDNSCFRFRSVDLRDEASTLFYLPAQNNVRVPP